MPTGRVCLQHLDLGAIGGETWGCSEGTAGVQADRGKADSLEVARAGVTNLLGSSTPWLPLLLFGGRGSGLTLVALS